MTSTGKAKLGNVSLISEGQYFNFKNFFAISYMLKIFDVERSSCISYIYWLNHSWESEKIFLNSTNSKFSDSDSTRSNNITLTSAYVTTSP